MILTSLFACFSLSLSLLLHYAAASFLQLPRFVLLYTLIKYFCFVLLSYFCVRTRVKKDGSRAFSYLDCYKRTLAHARKRARRGEPQWREEAR
uniref:Secreted protein n=1 Tax=Anopheles darlingi TaxID=43151 RepID=A0A2M4DB58_ANODA